MFNTKYILATVIGFLLIYIQVLFYIYTPYNVVDKIYDVIVLLLLLALFNCIWVISIAKNLKRNATFWGLFALILPPLCLIIIGLLDEKLARTGSEPQKLSDKNRIKLGDIYLEDDEK